MSVNESVDPFRKLSSEANTSLTHSIKVYKRKIPKGKKNYLIIF